MHESVTISLADGNAVSGLIDAPSRPECSYILAHGAGAGMTHRFLEDIALRLADRGVAVLRYQFPAMERGSARPDRPAVAHATVRAAIEFAGAHWPGLPLFAGGKSFGGRMTSQAQAMGTLMHIEGLMFLGFPLHAAGAPSSARAEHLSRVSVPTLFVQGTRDALAELTLINQVVEGLPMAEIALIDDADHSFHVRRSSGSNDEAVLDRLADIAAGWMGRVLSNEKTVHSSRPSTGVRQ